MFQQALKLDPTYALAFAGLGDAYWKKFADDKDPQWVQRSRESCQTAVSLDPNLAAANVSQGQYAEAIANLNHSISIRPSSTAYANLGMAYFSMRRFDEAAQSFEQAVKLNDEFYEGWWDLGDAHSFVPAKRGLAKGAYEKCVLLANARSPRSR